MSDIKDKLRELLSKQGLMTGAEWRQQAAEIEQRRASGEFEIESQVPGESVENEGGRFYLVRSDLPLDTPHGAVPLGAILEALPEHVALAAADPDLEAFDPATAVFLDTETTGLAGGAGTVAFLVGAGYFVEGAFRLDQCFMRDYDEEEAVLRHLDGVFGRCETVVSYNGKTFDVPLLRTRFIQNRIPFRLDSALQFDLLHAVRRFWKRRLQDCALSNIERQILDIHRQGDVSSAEIPEIWFEYLRTRDARRLRQVFYHHRMDVLSLVTLTAWLSRCLTGTAGKGFEHTQDRLSLVRVHFRARRYREVARHGQSFLEIEADTLLRRECLELMGLAAKRTQDWEAMENAWNLLLQENPRDLLARHELAKHHEHRTRNLIEAERICAETIDFLETRAALSNDGLTPWGLAAFQYRLERIRRKLARGIRADTDETDTGDDDFPADESDDGPAP